MGFSRHILRVGFLAALGGAAMFANVSLAKEKLVVAIYKSGTQQYFIDQGNGFTKAAEALGFDAVSVHDHICGRRFASLPCHQSTSPSLAKVGSMNGGFA